MTPEYLYELADIADPDQLWRLNGLDQQRFSPEQKRQVDMGVALRRHASDIEAVRNLPPGKSLLITPLVVGRGLSRRQSAIDTPEDIHKRAKEPQQ
ncbi:hypothetical protein AVMA1855_16800 [Acidovorax sp. SUPP1855]|uniref:hypothetical protein n=1 Tax=Acidovorax sp. SUPP1855 TaxID=431774 RepID=UPI0023DE69D9|nr:hypothetical protein [Acidovorax sp. SUPP1855]GKS85834.1 hypothetical protein AVMA1855_16800 [Acidovorax sp. SUPP1855]